jgi:hypothetical protein
MALPTIGIPTYETTLPSDGRIVKYRPFLVKEEKILLLALETSDKKGQYKALKQILKNCILSDITVEKLPVFDVEYLFVQIRGKSVGETLEPTVMCPVCKTSGKLKIALSEVNMGNTKQETPYKVMLSDKENIGITLVYPSMEMMEDIDPEKASSGDSETVFKLVAKSIDQIFEADKTHNPKDYTEKELLSFIETIPSNSFKKIIDFVSAMPRVQKEVAFKCPTCGTEKLVILKGIEDFFGSASLTTV